MKKIAIKKLLVAVAIATATNISFAQTPYDSFAPSSQKKEMLELPKITYRAYNKDSTGIINYMELDKEDFSISYFTSNDSLIQTYHLDPMAKKWLSIDPHARDYPSLSPYNFVGNMPILAVDPDGQDIYILYYTSGNNRGDEMFRAAALTRKVDIERSSHFDPAKDIVVVLAVQDMASIQKSVNNTVATYSPKYGATQEFSIWSHAGTDGPTGTVATSENAVDGKQMSMEGWSKIDFNWKNGGEGTNANFFGCRTGVNYEKKEISNYYRNENGGISPEYTITTTSFAKQISNLSNFANVNVSGQTSSAYPSQFTNYRLNSENGSDNFINFEKNGIVNFQRTYMVGGIGRSQDWNLNEQNIALPMQNNTNGFTTGTSFQSGTKK